MYRYKFFSALSFLASVAVIFAAILYQKQTVFHCSTYAYFTLINNSACNTFWNYQKIFSLLGNIALLAAIISLFISLFILPIETYKRWKASHTTRKPLHSNLIALLYSCLGLTYTVYFLVNCVLLFFSIFSKSLPADVLSYLLLILTFCPAPIYMYFCFAYAQKLHQGTLVKRAWMWQIILFLSPIVAFIAVQLYYGTLVPMGISGANIIPPSL